MTNKRDSQIEIVQSFAGGSHKILRKAFWGKTAQIAENFTALGKPMQPRTVRKMMEAATDVRRRNMLENTFLLLGVSALESDKTFNFVWSAIAACAKELRSNSVRARNAEEAFSDLRFANASVERAYLRGDLEKNPQMLLFASESLRGLFAHMNVNLSPEQENLMFSYIEESEAEEKPLLLLPGVAGV